MKVDQKEKSIVQSIKKKVQFFDWNLLIPYLILLGIGVFMVYSSSSYFAMSNLNNSEYFFKRQLMYAVISVLVVSFFSTINFRLLKSVGIISGVMFVLLFMLIYLVTLGVDPINGSSAWIDAGPINIQPSEFFKIAMILYLAVFLSNNQNKLANIGESYDGPAKENGKKRNTVSQIYQIVRKPLICLGVFITLILIQPDLGGVIILLSICVIMVLLSGVPFKISLATFGLAGAVYAVFIAFINLVGSIPFVPTYMLERFTAYLDPFGDMQNSSFQLVNSFYALARGGLFGVGIGESIQKSGYLPESYTDFIIPIMGEEIGLIGVLIILAIFFYLVYYIFRMSLRIRDSFGQLVCIGIASMFLIQGTINVGGAVGIMPLTGVTFPFISYGGSSILVSSMAIGILNNIYIYDRMNDR